MKQYRLQPGTSSRIYYLLTVKDDGTMLLYFHGTDRSLTEEASVNQDGWIVTKGAMYPPLSNGKWQEVEVVVADAPQNPAKSETKSEECSTFVPQEVTTTDGTDLTDNYSEPVELETTNFTNDTNDYPAEQNNAPAESQQPTANSQKPEHLDLFAQMQMQMQALRKQNEELRMKNEEFCNMIQTTRESEQQRAAARPTSPSPRRRRAVAVETPAAQAVALESDNGTSQLMKALSIAAASIVALVIIYNTGLLIPMGLIGLGASGLLK